MKKDFKFCNSKGVQYTVKEKYIPRKNKALGVCYHPHSKNPRIILQKNAHDRTRLAIIIEEMAHAFFWERSEKDIRRFSKTLSRFLWHEDSWRKTY